MTNKASMGMPKCKLTGLRMGGIRGDNKESREWRENKWIRRDEEKRSGNAKREEEAEIGSRGGM